MSKDTATSMSEEDKFFGVKTTFEKGKPLTKESDLELEVVDDRPDGDRRPPESKAAESGTDEELEHYGENVQKRIKKLTYKQHEERRKREEAERMREEAVKVAQQYAQQAQHYQQVISQGEKFIHEQAEARAQVLFEKAKQEYRQAYEEGNTDKVIQAQEEMMAAKNEQSAAQFNARNVRQPQPQQQRQQPQQRQQAAPQPKAPVPSQQAQEWASENKWFGQDKAMTGFAYGIHEKLVTEEGIEPDTDEYYEAINRTMRQTFPDHFGAEESGSVYATSSTRQSPPVVTAPSTRNNGAKPRKVRLNRTQIALAKRLGITPEQYANQLLKES
jgi:hypothetical protein